MKKIVVYFHGYKSSANSDKVAMLREAGFETYAWNIDVDPAVSLPRLTNYIDDMLLDNMHEPCEIFFVGTSLGAWYASNMGHLYGVQTILINPCYNPKESLAKYGVDQKILDNYLIDLQFASHQKVFIGSEDEVIDFSGVDFKGADNTLVLGADHRFNKEFGIVVDYIKDFK
jgi:predicted esterase YcpF (UPF0227 family)